MSNAEKITTLQDLEEFCSYYKISPGYRADDWMPVLHGNLRSLESVRRVLNDRFGIATTFECDVQGYYLVMPYRQANFDTGELMPVPYSTE